MIQYGVNVSADALKDMLQTSTDAAGNKTWEQLYSNASMNYQSQNNALMKTYGDTIAEAYKSNLQQQNALYDLGLSAGDTTDLQNMYRQELVSAYDTYLSNYRSSQNELASSYLEQKGLYDEALSTEAENFASLYNSAMDYYQNVLAGATRTKNDYDSPVYAGEGKEAAPTGDFNTITTSLINDYGLDWLTTTDEDGNVRALTENELMNSFFDENGVITDTGRNFYDMIFNGQFGDYTDSEGNQIISFDQWLSENNNDLYSWAHSADPFRHNELGNRLGSAREYVGLDATDEKFMTNQALEGMMGSLDRLQQSFETGEEYIKALDEIQNLTFLDDSKLQNNYDRLSDSYHESLFNNYYKLEEFREIYNEEQYTLYTEATSTVESLFGEDAAAIQKEIDDLYKKYGTANWTLTEDEITSVSNYGALGKRKHFGQEKTIKYNKAMKDMYQKLTSNNFREELNTILEKAYEKYSN